MRECRAVSAAAFVKPPVFMNIPTSSSSSVDKKARTGWTETRLRAGNEVAEVPSGDAHGDRSRGRENRPASQDLEAIRSALNLDQREMHVAARLRSAHLSLSPKRSGEVAEDLDEIVELNILGMNGLPGGIPLKRIQLDDEELTIHATSETAKPVAHETT